MANNGHEVDVDEFQASLDESVAAARARIDAWVPTNLGPQWNAVNNGTEDSSKSVLSLRQRPPRLGLGADATEFHKRQAEEHLVRKRLLLGTTTTTTSELKERDDGDDGNRSNKKLKTKHSRNDKDDDQSSSSDDESESRASAIKGKAKKDNSNHASPKALFKSTPRNPPHLFPSKPLYPLAVADKKNDRSVPYTDKAPSALRDSQVPGEDDADESRKGREKQVDDNDEEADEDEEADTNAEDSEDDDKGNGDGDDLNKVNKKKKKKRKKKKKKKNQKTSV